MRQISRSGRFKKDYKKLQVSAKDIAMLKDCLFTLSSGKKLDEKFNDHPLSGNWKGYRELHLKPDWLLIYKVTDTELRLARIGSHSQLFG